MVKVTKKSKQNNTQRSNNTSDHKTYFTKKFDVEQQAVIVSEWKYVIGARRCQIENLVNREIFSIEQVLNKAILKKQVFKTSTTAVVRYRQQKTVYFRKNRSHRLLSETHKVHHESVSASFEDWVNRIAPKWLFAQLYREHLQVAA